MRPQGFKRCLANLVKNAVRHGDRVMVTGTHENGLLTIKIDDDGPGVPLKEREAVFKPFSAASTPATSTRAGPASASPSLATSPEATAATSPSTGARSAAFGCWW